MVPSIQHANHLLSDISHHALVGLLHLVVELHEQVKQLLVVFRLQSIFLPFQICKLTVDSLANGYGLVLNF